MRAYAWSVVSLLIPFLAFLVIAWFAWGRPAPSTVLERFGWDNAVMVLGIIIVLPLGLFALNRLLPSVWYRPAAIILVIVLFFVVPKLRGRR